MCRGTKKFTATRQAEELEREPKRSSHMDDNVLSFDTNVCVPPSSASAKKNCKWLLPNKTVSGPIFRRKKLGVILRASRQEAVLQSSGK